jgi:hypothetical protein
MVSFLTFLAIAGILIYTENIKALLALFLAIIAFAIGFIV